VPSFLFRANGEGEWVKAIFARPNQSMAPSSRLLTRKAAREDRMLVGLLRFKQYTPRRRENVFMACFATRQADGPDFKFGGDNASASQSGVGGVFLFIAVSPCYCI
jgi:hypothetical protein